MSRMKKLATAAVTAGAALALGAVQTLGRVIAGGPDAPTDRNGRVWTPGAFRRAMRYRGYGRSRHMPHQGIQEQYRRRGQIMRGHLVSWKPPIEPTPAAPEPAPVSAKVLIANGEDAERRAANKARAEKAARTRAANKAAKLEVSNG